MARPTGLTLAQLEPELSRCEERIEPRNVAVGDASTWQARGRPTESLTGPVTYHVGTAKLHKAQQILFLCPACYRKNNGPVGTHSVLVGFHGRGLLPHQSSHNSKGEPSRWHASGTGIDDLTLTPSIDCGCWHGYVTAGKITDA